MGSIANFMSSKTDYSVFAKCFIIGPLSVGDALNIYEPSREKINIMASAKCIDQISLCSPRRLIRADSFRLRGIEV